MRDSSFFVSSSNRRDSLSAAPRLPQGSPSTPASEDMAMQRLFDMVREKRGIDLTQYSDSYLKRRLALQLKSKGCASLDEFTKLLSRDVQEIDLFLESLIVRVTEFFRSPTTFEALEKRIFPALLVRKQAEFSHVIRCWSAGCSSGEEPYSLGILIRETLRQEKERYSALVFATDMDQKSLTIARRGVFERKRLMRVRQDWKDAYFEREGERYRVKEEIRRMVIFRAHNLQDPPPFRNLDLILFRNVLIYLKPDLQRSLLLKFLEILNPGGYLVLGRTEGGAGVVPPQYEVIEAAERIYRRPLSENEFRPLGSSFSKV